MEQSNGLLAVESNDPPKRGRGRPPTAYPKKYTALAVPEHLYEALRLEACRKGVKVVSLGAELLAAGLFRAEPKKDADK